MCTAAFWTNFQLLFDQAEDNEIFDPFYERFSQRSISKMDLDEAFTENQTALVRITPEYCQQLPTVKHDIVYTGALDHQFTSGSFYS